jgi:hypothetical protein
MPFAEFVLLLFKKIHITGYKLFEMTLENVSCPKRCKGKNYGAIKR